MQEVAHRAQQLKGLVVNCDIAQGEREGYLVLEREVVHLHAEMVWLRCIGCALG